MFGVCVVFDPDEKIQDEDWWLKIEDKNFEEYWSLLLSYTSLDYEDVLEDCLKESDPEMLLKKALVCILDGKWRSAQKKFVFFVGT